MRHIFKILLLLINLFVGAALAFTAIVGTLDPEYHPALVIATMTFPAWAVIALVILLVDFFYMRSGCIWIAFCFIFSLPLALTVMPLNIPRGKIPERYENVSWTLLSYNVYQFFDFTNEYPDKKNPAVEYILQTDADVAILAEGRWLNVLKNNYITPETLDSLHRKYPYLIVGQDITLMSKFPAEVIELDNFPNQLYGKSHAHSKVGAFMVDIHGVKTAIFGIHLKSLGLTRSDKDAYEDFTRGQGFTSSSEIAFAKNDIIGKIADANIERAVQVNAMIEEINKLDCENVIVTGDFNDTPGCYALNALEKIGLREVYPLVGNGYMNTYNRDRLLFQIDHVLFRGAFRPWSIRRGNLKSSDHYPLVVTFI